MLSREADVDPQEGHLHCRELFERLCAAAEGEEPLCAELAAHLRSCEPCRRVLESLEATRKTLSAFGGSPAFPPEESRALLEECLRKLREDGHSGT
jgi:hypothetical protein